MNKIDWDNNTLKIDRWSMEIMLKFFNQYTMNVLAFQLILKQIFSVCVDINVEYNKLLKIHVSFKCIQNHIFYFETIQIF